MPMLSVLNLDMDSQVKFHADLQHLIAYCKSLSTFMQVYPNMAVTLALARVQLCCIMFRVV